MQRYFLKVLGHKIIIPIQYSVTRLGLDSHKIIFADWVFHEMDEMWPTCGQVVPSVTQWLAALTVDAYTATVLGSIPASADTVVLNAAVFRIRIRIGSGIQIQSGQLIQIRNPDPDPGG